MLEFFLAIALVFLVIKTRRYFDKYLLNDTVDQSSQYIAIKHRAFGSSLYFGPFRTLNDLKKWSTEEDMSVVIIELTNPKEWSKLDYSDRW